jgi:hypothetical protein
VKLRPGSLGRSPLLRLLRCGLLSALRLKTVKIYRGLLRCHIAPHLATVTVGEMTLARVRHWRKKLIDSAVSAITVAKA